MSEAGAALLVNIHPLLISPRKLLIFPRKSLIPTRKSLILPRKSVRCGGGWNLTGRLFPTTNCQEEKIQNLAKLIYIFHKIPNSDWVSDSVEADQKGFQHLFCFQLFPGLAFYSCLLMHQLMSVRIWRGFTEIKAFPGAARNSHGNSTDRQGGLGTWVRSGMWKFLHRVVV